MDISEDYKDAIMNFAKRHNIRKVFSLRCEIGNQVTYRLFTSKKNALEFGRNMNDFVFEYDTERIPMAATTTHTFHLSPSTPPEGKVCTAKTEGYDVSNPALQPTYKMVLHTSRAKLVCPFQR